MELGTRKDLQVGIGLALVALLVYANTLGNGFVWDDDIVILANSALRGDPLALFSGIDSGRTTEITPYYRPLSLLSFLVEGRLHGFTPYLMRLCNILLHCANTFLVYRLVREFNVSIFGALVAGIIFAVHPLNSETVDFLAGGRNTMLAAFFALTSYLSYHWSVRNGSWLGGLASASLFMAGLLSKETALAILPFIVAREFSCQEDERPRSARQSLVSLLPFVSAVALYLVLRDNALSLAGVSLEIIPGLSSRLLNNLFIIPRYLFNVVWPSLLSPKYFIPDDFNLYALPLTCAWLSIASLIWWFCTRGRSRATLFGLAWLVAFWLPVSGIFPIPSAPLADRYCYLPAIGLWLVIGDQFGRFLPAQVAMRNAALAVVAVIVVLFATVTVRQNMTWHDDVALFSRLVELYPDQAYGHHNLGCAYLDKVKNVELAEKSFERALTLDPFFPRLRTQMGFVRMQRGLYEQALEQYDHAVFLNPKDAEAQLNRGVALERLGRNAEALDSYRRFLALPGDELPLARKEIKERMRDLAR